MSDWWTQPSTPARASAFHSPARSNSTRARFVSDDPDPGVAEGPKFLPSFAASPAGKLALGTSPGSAASPPATKRSPQARFSVSVPESISSPRARKSLAPQEDDIIPTASLHDERPASAPVGNEPSTSAMPVPPALEPGLDTTTLHVFGPPPEHLASLRGYLEGIGPVVSYVPGPDGSNWWTVTFANALAASYALRRHGEIVSGRWMLGFKVAGPRSTSGLTLVEGEGPVVSSAVASVGTPMQVRSANIIRAKPKAPVATDDYAWEEPQQASGILGRAAEFIFGR